MASTSATVSINLEVEREIAFNFNVPIDLSTIFSGYGLLPAVIAVKDQTGRWDASGQTRTVVLSDGSSSHEMLTVYDCPKYFSYIVSEFTGALGRLVNTANGEWWFSTLPNGRTHVKWRYAFTSKSTMAYPVLWLIVKTLWRSYMRKAIKAYGALVTEHALALKK